MNIKAIEGLMIQKGAIGMNLRKGDTTVDQIVTGQDQDHLTSRVGGHLSIKTKAVEVNEAIIMKEAKNNLDIVEVVVIQWISNEDTKKTMIGLITTK